MRYTEKVQPTRTVLSLGYMPDTMLVYLVRPSRDLTSALYRVVFVRGAMLL